MNKKIDALIRVISLLSKTLTKELLEEEKELQKRIKTKDGVTICAKCAFHTTGQYIHEHICIAHVKSTLNFVTGKRHLTGYEPCKKMNPCGKCSFYNAIREPGE